MSVHSVMIRLEYGADYADRYAKTVEAIKKQAVGPVWEEPTSVYIFQSSKTAQEVCDAIYYGAPVYESRDTLVVVNLSIKGASGYAQKGAKYPATLKGLMDAR